MFSYNVYLMVHLTGIFLTFAALGGAALSGPDTPPSRRKARGMFHGIGLFLVLLGGFGLLARIGFPHGASWPLWLLSKLGIWFLLGASIIAFRRLPALGVPLLLIAIALGVTSGYLARNKPGQDAWAAAQGAGHGAGHGEAAPAAAEGSGD
jgi:hypothetical protein